MKRTLAGIILAIALAGCRSISGDDFNGQWHDPRSGETVELKLNKDHSAVLIEGARSSAGKWTSDRQYIRIVFGKTIYLGARDPEFAMLARYRDEVDKHPDLFQKVSKDER